MKETIVKMKLKAFTLLEFLIAILILAILFAVGIPYFNASKTASLERVSAKFKEHLELAKSVKEFPSPNEVFFLKFNYKILFQ